MTINKKETTAKEFVYDGCHKIYLIEDEEDKRDALDCGYEIRPIKELEKTFEGSCPLRFIHNWKLDKTYVAQFESATFKE